MCICLLLPSGVFNKCMYVYVLLMLSSAIKAIARWSGLRHRRAMCD